ncbi:MAG TPA: radical SAM protein [Candidatus Methylomirabilis sp.]|nr:radical SAM protein [Candidatus Methylomirabilis sp.]
MPPDHPAGPGSPMAAIHNREHQLRLVFWETTAGCNLECQHCRRLEVARELMRSDLSTAEALSLVDAIAVLGRPILVLSGGEPLLRPDIYDIARHGVRRGLPVSLATNGTLIDHAVARQIRAAGIVRCAVSIDGATAATHDVFRRQLGAFHQALEGIGALRAAGCDVQINTTIAQHNEHEIRGIYDLAVGVGAVALHCFMLVPVGCGLAIAEDQMLSPVRYEEVLNDIYDLASEGRLHVKATCAPHYYRVIRQRAKREGRPLQLATDGMAAMTKGCLAGSAVCFISHKGEVFPCGYLPVEAGHIRRERFADIWERSPVFARLRDADLLGGKCGPCEFKTVCAGCRARAYAATGDFLAEEPFCAYQPRRQERCPPGSRGMDGRTGG